MNKTPAASFKIGKDIDGMRLSQLGDKWLDTSNKEKESYAQNISTAYSVVSKTKMSKKAFDGLMKALDTNIMPAAFICQYMHGGLTLHMLHSDGKTIKKTRNLIAERINEGSEADEKWLEDSTLAFFENLWKTTMKGNIYQFWLDAASLPKNITLDFFPDCLLDELEKNKQQPTKTREVDTLQEMSDLLSGSSEEEELLAELLQITMTGLKEATDELKERNAELEDLGNKSIEVLTNICKSLGCTSSDKMDVEVKESDAQARMNQMFLKMTGELADQVTKYSNCNLSIIACGNSVSEIETKVRKVCEGISKYLGE